ncbi:hypothetical protein LXA43DRAFT_1096144 [Ganoderma leucocontextum]|nr:hypothetical protein LXA43DRAFT_1096144 [Ganoderma leucocontextum]
MTDPLLSSVLRLRTKAKNVAQTQVRNPYRRRKKAIKLTQEERRAKQAVRDAKKISLTTALMEARKSVMDLAANLAQQFPGHDKEYYHKLIMQMPATKSKHVISEWCAFLSIQMEKHNEELVKENGENTHRDRVTKGGILQEISGAWAALSREEKHAVTADKVKELEERRENRLQAVHNTNISACHDARVTLKNVKTELENLHQRTGTTTLLVATRGSVEAFGDPVIHYSDPRVQQFMESTMGATLEDTALRMEAYCVSGVQGVVSNQLERAGILRNQLGNLILAKLQDTARRAKRGEIKRMNYLNFSDAITGKCGIVAENWATRFENPSGLSCLEVEIALRAWESGTTCFRALTDEEWRAWLEGRYTPQASPETTPPINDPSPADSVHSPTVAVSEQAPSTTNGTSESAPLAENAPPMTLTNQSAASTLPEKRTPTEAEAIAPAAKRVRAEPVSVSFINSATPAAGEAFSVPKATQKKCSDTGIPRGPRKKPANAASENVPPSAATPPAAKPSKARGRRAKQPVAAESVATTPAA